MLYVNKNCTGHGTSNSIELGTSIGLTGWDSYSRCKICGITKENVYVYLDFVVCPDCAKITERCLRCLNCGKLE